MNFEDLKEQLKEKWDELVVKVSESEAFIQLSERYNNLSPLVQKIIIFSAIFFVGYLIYSVPAGFIDSAQQVEANFNQDRTLMRGLNRSARNPVISPDQFTGLPFEQIRSRIDGIASESRVLDSQKGAVTQVNKPLPNSVVPNAIRQEGVSYELKKLTLRQAVAISERLSSMHNNTKLAGVTIEADKEDPHYFTVRYTMSSLSLPLKSDKKKRR
ncbi:MAG: hypothetical protein H6623_07685 [Bdellovibrionaceae bacterium]|nr:hypothetical protein [Pseudobdellovibrionaceae bacterium]